MADCMELTKNVEFTDQSIQELTCNDNTPQIENLLDLYANQTQSDQEKKPDSVELVLEENCQNYEKQLQECAQIVVTDVFNDIQPKEDIITPSQSDESERVIENQEQLKSESVQLENNENMDYLNTVDLLGIDGEDCGKKDNQRSEICYIDEQSNQVKYQSPVSSTQLLNILSNTSNNKRYTEDLKNDSIQYQISQDSQRIDPKDHLNTILDSFLPGKQNAYNKENQIRSKNIQPSQKQVKKTPPKPQITDLLQIDSLPSINFGNVLPGNIFEENLEIHNKTTQPLVTKLLIQCLNSDYDDHDEYVYSVRKSSAYDYNEKYIVLIPPLKSIQFKIALKVPNTHLKQNLKGQVQIHLQGVPGVHQISVEANIQQPNIQCQKQLFNMEQEMQVIKVAVKRGRKCEIKIPFKNCYTGGIQVCPEVEGQDDDGYEIVVNQAGVNVTGNGMFLINMGVKEKNGETKKGREMRKVLMLKIKNSSLIFHYPMILEVY